MQAAVENRWTDRKGMDVLQDNVENHDNTIFGNMLIGKTRICEGYVVLKNDREREFGKWSERKDK